MRDEYDANEVYSNDFEMWWSEYRVSKGLNNITGALEGAFREVAFDAWKACSDLHYWRHQKELAKSLYS